MMANHEYWLTVCRQLATDNHSKARNVWNRLNQNQRGLLLHAAGLSSRFIRYGWDELDNRQLLQLKRGIQRLKTITGMFGAFSDLDFVHPVKVTAVNKTEPHKLAISKIDALIEARNQLKESTASRSSH